MLFHKYLLAATLGLFAIGASARAWPVHAQDSARKTAPATKSVSGKITSIDDTGVSFALAVDGDSKQTMEFVLVQGTQVQGSVKLGARVAVEYQPAGASGQNLAVTITVRS